MPALPGRQAKGMMTQDPCPDAEEEGRGADAYGECDECMCDGDECGHGGTFPSGVGSVVRNATGGMLRRDTSARGLYGVPLDYAIGPARPGPSVGVGVSRPRIVQGVGRQG